LVVLLIYELIYNVNAHLDIINVIIHLYYIWFVYIVEKNKSGLLDTIDEEISLGI
jgi:hypothetical protein